MKHNPKTVVVGLGNPILGNDGVGWKIAEEVQKRLPPDAPVDVSFLSLGGICLMERLIGYDAAILIDAIKSDEASGSIISMRLEDMPNYSTFHTNSAHDASLQNALEMGKSMGAKLPSRVMVVGVTTEKSFEFSETLTPTVQAAVPLAAQIALDLLKALK
ncbi:MAG: hydrogenase maturation protease [Anaerolineales bacterium]|nr:hydrogenase maturation protease [Anaerolineales bacterium]